MLIIYLGWLWTLSKAFKWRIRFSVQMWVPLNVSHIAGSSSSRKVQTELWYAAVGRAAVGEGSETIMVRLLFHLLSSWVFVRLRKLSFGPLCLEFKIAWSRRYKDLMMESDSKAALALDTEWLRQAFHACFQLVHAVRAYEDIGGLFSRCHTHQEPGGKSSNGYFVHIWSI